MPKKARYTRLFWSLLPLWQGVFKTASLWPLRYLSIYELPYGRFHRIFNCFRNSFRNALLCCFRSAEKVRCCKAFQHFCVCSNRKFSSSFCPGYSTFQQQKTSESWKMQKKSTPVSYHRNVGLSSILQSIYKKSSINLELADYIKNRFAVMSLFLMSFPKRFFKGKFEFYGLGRFWHIGGVCHFDRENCLWKSFEGRQTKLWVSEKVPALAVIHSEKKMQGRCRNL